MVLKNLLRRRIRTLLTLAGISIGIAAIVSLGAIALGLEAGYASLTREADIIVEQKDTFDITISVVKDEVGQEIAAMPEVEEVAGMLFTLVPMPGIRYFPLLGYEPGSFPLRRFLVVEGEQLTGRGEIIMGRAAASKLGKGVGDTVEVYGSSFRLVGIYETGEPHYDGGAVVSLEDARSLTKQPDTVTAFLIKVKELDRAEEIRQEIEQRFPSVSALLSADFASRSGEVQLFRSLGWAVSFLALLIGAVGMTNTMIMSVMERRRELGILRAVGWRKRRVLRLILGESLVLAFLGGVMGMMLGIIAVKLLNQWGGGGAFLRGDFSPSLFLQAGAVAIFLGVAGGLYPAWQATRVIPVEALRYEVGGGGEPSRPFPGGMVVRNLLRRRTRSILTLLSIGIAIAVIVATMAIADGFVEQYAAMLTRGGIDLVARQAGISDMGYSAIDETVGRELAAMPEVEHISGGIVWAARIEEFPLFIIFAYDPREYAIQQFHLVEGRSLEREREVLLGKGAAERLNKRIGDEIEIMDTSFRVVGIYGTGVALEDSAAVISLDEAQHLFGKPDQVMFYTIKLKRPWEADRVLREIEERIPEIAVFKSAEFAEKLPDMQTTRAMVAAISFLVVLVGGVGMTNTMVMSVFERKREIGVLRALGWRRRRILEMILREALLLSFLAGIAGIAMGVGLGRGLALIPVVSGWLQPDFNLSAFLQAMVIALALGSLGGLYPAWRASGTDPVEALRYE